MTEPAVLPAIAALREEMVTLRRHIHAHPELGFEERRTAALVAECLEAWGYQVSRGVGRTGVVGTLCRGEGPALGLRADMDALPIQEATGLPYASQVDGVMHACGHDGHTAMLLAAARHLVESPHWRGTLQLIFQPAEEGLGGARAMLDDGLLERFPCDAIFAMHNVPGYPVGHLGFHPGPFMASYRHRGHPRDRQRRPRRGAAAHRRPGGGLLRHRAGLAEHRLAQRRPAGHRDRQRRRDPCRDGLQRDPGQRRNDPQRPRPDRGNPCPAGAPHRRTGPRPGRQLRRAGGGRLPALPSGAGQPSRADRVRPRGGPRLAGRGMPDRRTAYRSPPARISPSSSNAVPAATW